MTTIAEDKPDVVRLEEYGKPQQTVLEIDDETNRRLVRKIDWKLMPVVSLFSSSAMLRPRHCSLSLYTKLGE